jgi:hypothetical protein
MKLKRKKFWELAPGGGAHLYYEAVNPCLFSKDFEPSLTFGLLTQSLSKIRVGSPTVREGSKTKFGCGPAAPTSKLADEARIRRFMSALGVEGEHFILPA